MTGRTAVARPVMRGAMPHTHQGIPIIHMPQRRVIMQRTLWAEKFVDSFSSRPLTAECVFHSPQYIDRGKQKEVCDLLLMLRGNAILCR